MGSSAFSEMQAGLGLRVDLVSSVEGGGLAGFARIRRDCRLAGGYVAFTHMLLCLKPQTRKPKENYDIGASLYDTAPQNLVLIFKAPVVPPLRSAPIMQHKPR